MLFRLKTVLLCWLFGHDEEIVAWDDHGMILRCRECDRPRHEPLPRKTP